MRRTRRPLAALAMVALISAGCGAGSSGHTTPGSDRQETATASSVDNRNASAAPTGANTPASDHEKAVKFSECMRANGISAFPDPSASGQLTIDGVLNGSSLDPNSAAWKQAVGACKDLEPPGFVGKTATPRQMGARLEFARCMRDNGVPDFPDPTPNGPLIDTNLIPSLAGKDPRTDPGLNAAMRTCRVFASAAGVVRP